MKDTALTFLWLVVLGACIGISTGWAVATIVGGVGGIANEGLIGGFVGASLALGFWTIAFAHVGQDDDERK